MPLEPSDLDELYSVPLAKFVQARKALASRLREADRPYDAAVVEELKKPSIAVWAINQVARQDRVAVERLVRTVERLRAVQLGRAGSDGDALKRVTAEQRKALKTLTDRAEAVLTSAGMPPSRALLERIATTLQAAATDENARRQLQRGQLTEELAPAGFGALAGTLPLRPPPRRGKARATSGSLVREAADLDQMRERARQTRSGAAEQRRGAPEARHAAEEAEKNTEREPGLSQS